MKLIRYQDGQNMLRLGQVTRDTIHPVQNFEQLIPIFGVEVHNTVDRIPFKDVQPLAPLRPKKIVAIGRNYRKHAAELGNVVPENPMLFAIFPSSVIAPHATIEWNPKITQQVDWEGELAVVIGREARHVPVADALDYVFGYTIANDISARDLQKSDGQWIRAKSMETFCPLGPAIVTREMIPDPQTLQIQTDVNGERVQDESTLDMVHSVADLITYCSQMFTLEPGDVLLTGTPSGVGKGFDPPRYLKTGDVVSIHIAEIGTLTNRCQEVEN